MKAFITGGTGFVGSAVVRKLLADGHQVRALVRPGTNTRMLDGMPVERVRGDLSDVALLQQAMAGCEWVFHVAALYAYWGYSWDEFHQSNVEGTRRVLEAASRARVERIVHTSSIASLGIPSDGTPGDEETPVTLTDMLSDYKRSKYLAEKVVDEFVCQGLPVVTVNPAAPVGIGDHKPTQTGKMIVDYLNGKMPAYVDTGLTIVDVDDVAAGHLLAMEKGRIGERYILGGENLTLKQVLDLLAEVSGLPKVKTRIPRAIALAWAYVDTSLARLNPRHIPAATPAAVRVSSKKEYFSSAKAMRDLGYTFVPAREALRKAVEWYRANGYIKGSFHTQDSTKNPLA
jgi:dihydroflavonol-4-reductase